VAELESVDRSWFVRGAEGDPRLGSRVQAGPVRPLADGERASATVALLGIADDRGVVNGGGRAGASQGPREIRRWLYKMTTGGQGELEGLRLFDLGDATPGEGGARSIEEVHALAEESIRAALEAGARVVLLGGGHDGAYASHSGLLRALPGDARVGAINVDAHCDVRPLRPESDCAPGERITSGTPFRRLKERWGERYSLVEFGIQMQHNARAQVEWARAQGWPVLELRRLREDGCEKRFARQLASASAAASVVAVSFDLDAVQAASAPGVSAPCPDGFSAAELYAFARAAGSDPAVRLLDVMECSPPLDEGGRTARLAAGAIWSFLAAACEGR